MTSRMQHHRSTQPFCYHSLHAFWSVNEWMNHRPSAEWNLPVAICMDPTGNIMEICPFVSLIQKESSATDIVLCWWNTGAHPCEINANDWKKTSENHGFNLLDVLVLIGSGKEADDYFSFFDAGFDAIKHVNSKQYNRKKSHAGSLRKIWRSNKRIGS